MYYRIRHDGRMQVSSDSSYHPRISLLQLSLIFGILSKWLEELLTNYVARDRRLNCLDKSENMSQTPSDSQNTYYFKAYFCMHKPPQPNTASVKSASPYRCNNQAGVQGAHFTNVQLRPASVSHQHTGRSQY